MKKLKMICLGLMLTGLNSCYFNSAGHIFDRAEYAAALSTYGIKAHDGGMVYTDGQSYYIDVRMCRYDTPIRLQYDAFSQNAVQSEQKMVSRVVMRTAEIPADFAKYLMGQASSPKAPSYMKLAKSSVKKKCQSYPIKQTPEIVDEFFQYRSPGAVGYYTLGALGWLCVDLPITCVENALAIPCYTVGSVLNGLGKGMERMGRSFEKSTARMNVYNGGARVSVPQASYVLPTSNVRYAPPLQSSSFSYSTPVVESHGYAPALQSSSSSMPSSSSSYMSSGNMTLQDIEAQRELNRHLHEVHMESLRERKESFNSMMNLINTESSVKYVP